MRVIPVIDLKQGEVVRGVGGRREEYRRVESVLTRDVTPGGVAQALAERFPVAELYVADLDAIAGGEPNWPAYEAIGRSGLRLWIDAGAGDVDRAGQVAAFVGAAVEAVVIGLESLVSPAELRRIATTVGAPRIAFSLDLKEGRPLTAIAAWRGAAPERIAEEIVSSGLERMIVLDLAHVGENRGVGGADLCRQLHERFPELELIGGGGVRSRDDAHALAQAGCRAVLVASALHDGRLTPQDVARLAADESRMR